MEKNLRKEILRKTVFLKAMIILDITEAILLRSISQKWLKKRI